MKNKIHILIGLPASGKSTYAREEMKFENKIIHCTDEIRESLFNYEFNALIRERVFRELIKRVKKSILEDRYSNIVIDTSFLNSLKDRIRFLEDLYILIKEYGIDLEITLYYFSSNIEQCLERNQRKPPKRRLNKEIINYLEAELEIPKQGDYLESEFKYKIEIIYQDKIEDILDKVTFNTSLDKRSEKKLWELFKASNKIKEYIGEPLALNEAINLLKIENKKNILLDNTSICSIEYCGTKLKVDYEIVVLIDTERNEQRFMDIKNCEIVGVFTAD